MTKLPKEKQDPIKVAIENNACSLCRAMGYPICRGHGGNEGGGGSGGDSSGSKNEGVKHTLDKVTGISAPIIDVMNELDKAKSILVSQLLSDKKIDYAAGLLTVHSDRLRGDLIFKIQPGLSKSEIQTSLEFLKAVKAEFEEFKNELNDRRISTKNFNAVLKDNELAIHIPVPTYYDAFIMRLENKNLLPIPRPGQQKKKEVTNESYKQERKSPLSPLGDILKGPKPPA